MKLLKTKANEENGIVTLLTRQHVHSNVLTAQTFLKRGSYRDIIAFEAINWLNEALRNGRNTRLAVAYSYLDQVF